MMHIHHWHYRARHSNRHCCRCDLYQQQRAIRMPATPGWFCKKKRGSIKYVWVDEGT